MRLRAVLGVLVMLQLGCGETQQGDAPADPQSRPSVYVVSYPLKFFAEYLADGAVQVEFPAPDGIDPAYWSPAPEVVLGYQQADLILLNGAGYASWTDRVSLPPSRLVNTSAGVEGRFLPVENAVTHTHGPEGEHSHDELAVTSWSPKRCGCTRRGGGLRC